MMIEIGGIVVNPALIEAAMPPVPALGLPCRLLTRSGMWLNCYADLNDIKEALDVSS